MSSTLRRLAVYVAEQESGKFNWVIAENTAATSPWLDVEAGFDAFAMWIDAWDAGNVALLKLVDDERFGPRVVGEDEDADPVG